MQVEVHETISDDLTFLFIKYPDSLAYSDQIQKLYEMGIPKDHLERFVYDTFNSRLIHNEDDRVLIFENLSNLLKNNVHQKLIEWYLDVENFCNRNTEFTNSVIKLYELYREFRSKGETDVEEEDLVKAIAIAELSIESLIEYFRTVKKSDLFKKILICNSPSEFDFLVWIINSGITDEQFQYIAEGEVSFLRLVLIQSLISHGIKDERLTVALNPKLNVDQIRQIVDGFIIDGLSAEEVLSYANPEYDEKTMESIRLSLKSEIGGNDYAS